MLKLSQRPQQPCQVRPAVAGRLPQHKECRDFTLCLVRKHSLADLHPDYPHCPHIPMTNTETLASSLFASKLRFCLGCEETIQQVQTLAAIPTSAELKFFCLAGCPDPGHATDMAHHGIAADTVRRPTCGFPSNQDYRQFPKEPTGSAGRCACLADLTNRVCLATFDTYIIGKQCSACTCAYTLNVIAFGVCQHPCRSGGSNARDFEDVLLTTPCSRLSCCSVSDWCQLRVQLVGN